MTGRMLTASRRPVLECVYACNRCGTELNAPRVDRRHVCTDCKEAEGLEARAETRGLDLATLPEEWWDLLYRKGREAAQTGLRIRRERLLDSLVERVFDVDLTAGDHRLAA